MHVTRNSVVCEAISEEFHCRNWKPRLVFLAIGLFSRLACATSAAVLVPRPDLCGFIPRQGNRN